MSRVVEEISLKNTKSEILDAYYEVLKKLEQTKKLSKQEEKLIAEKKEIVTEASIGSADEIVKGLANLKLTVNKSLKELEDQLLNENKKLTTLQKAINIQTQDLEELHEKTYEITFTKREIKRDLPLQIGVAVYHLAKLRMLEFYYDFIDKYIDREDFQY